VRDNLTVDDLGGFDAVARQAQVAVASAHRPWPLPAAPWSLALTRRDVLLAHWSLPGEELARRLPPGLVADLFGGSAWLGLAAYRVLVFRLRGLPPLPGTASFLQLEVRAPVRQAGRPGLWLFQLETGKQLVAEVLKRTHRLPACGARLSLREAGDGRLAFEAQRDGHAFAVDYAAAGHPFVAAPGTLEHFLTERYALYTGDGGRIYRAELNHLPWSLERATALFGVRTLTPPLPPGEPNLLYSAAQDVLLWPLEEL
jgi:uncharacterized protein